MRIYMTRIFAIMSFIIILLQNTSAQTPQNYPAPGPEPVEINLFNVLVYIGVPALIILLYILIRRRSSKGKF